MSVGWRWKNEIFSIFMYGTKTHGVWGFWEENEVAGEDYIQYWSGGGSVLWSSCALCCILYCCML